MLSTPCYSISTYLIPRICCWFSVLTHSPLICFELTLCIPNTAPQATSNSTPPPPPTKNRWKWLRVSRNRKCPPTHTLSRDRLEFKGTRTVFSSFSTSAPNPFPMIFDQGRGYRDDLIRSVMYVCMEGEGRLIYVERGKIRDVNVFKK